MIITIVLLCCVVIGLVLGMVQDYFRYVDHEERLEDIERMIQHEYMPLLREQQNNISEPLFFDLSFDVDANDYEEIIEP